MGLLYIAPAAEVSAVTFEDKQQEQKLITLTDPETTYKGSGYIPSPLKVKRSEKVYKNNLYTSSTLPAKYDLRNYNYVTDVRDQGEIGACWTFSTYGSLESVIKKNSGETFDFSEINMAVHNGVTSPNAGGNNHIAAAYLTSWKGPILESEDPYPNPGIESNIKVRDGLKPKYRVQDIIFLPSRLGPLDNSEIKNAIKNYGAVSSSYYDSSDYYIDNGQASYYNPDRSMGNHAITIVGWDDNFSKSNFKITPPGDGAFLIKNSWGSRWGDDGYFYISYYDISLGYDTNAIYNGIENADNYKSMYSHSDKTMNSYYEGYDFGGNRYTAKTDEILSAVGFYTFDQDVYYEIWIDKIVNGEVKAPQQKITTGNLQQGGYHTIKLLNKVSLKQGEEFMVWIKLVGGGLYGYSDSTLAAEKSYLQYYGSPINSDIVLGINAYTELYDSSEFLSVFSEVPNSGELYTSQSIKVTFNDYIYAGTDFSKISLKDENGIEVNKSVTIENKSLIVKELPENHANGKLKLFIPKGAVKDSAGKVMYTDFSREYTVYLEPSIVVNFKDAKLEQVVRSTLDKSSEEVITVGDMRTIVELDARYLDITNLGGIEYATNLYSLELSYNQIISLEPISALKQLTYLNISGNLIKDITPLEGLNNLEYLYMWDNDIRDIYPLKNMQNLQSLDFSDNFVKDLSAVKELNKISDLNFENNLITEISALEVMIKNSINNNISLHLGGNYIDFSADSEASRIIKVLEDKGTVLYGTEYQKSGLNIVSINGSTNYWGNSLDAGEKIIVEFNDDIGLSSNAANLIYLEGDNNKRYKIAAAVYGNQLIITPLENTIEVLNLYVSINQGVVYLLNNKAITNNYEIFDFSMNTGYYGDLDNNSKVEITDLEILSSDYNEDIDTSESWDQSKDLNSDGIIDIFDIVILGGYI